MKQDIVNVLNEIEKNGFEAYIIGGYVRDKLLGIESYDIDIATSALPKDLIKIFNISSKRTTMYGTMKLLSNKYRFDIATYRKELSYDGRRPDNIEYIKSLKEDILRRDFTINTIAMNKNGDILDYQNGIKDLQNKIIKSVGDANLKLKEDPLRILRALRFSIVLDFKIDDYLLKSIKKNIRLIKTLSSTRIKEELSKILISRNCVEGLEFMKKLGVLKLLNISYKNLVYVDDINGMYAQINLFKDYPFTKEEKNNINIIKNIKDRGKIDNITLFNYGLYHSMVAGQILGYDKEEIALINKNLPIKSKKDLAINFNDIKLILNTDENVLVVNTINDLINNILLNKLKNEKDDLVYYVINQRK